MISDKEKYVEDVEIAFQADTEKEKTYLEHLIGRIYDYGNEHDEATYSDYVEYFGSPKELVLAYLESNEENSIVRKTTYKSWIKPFCIVISIFIIIYFIFAMGSFIEGRKSYVDSYTETITE